MSVFDPLRTLGMGGILDRLGPIRGVAGMHAKFVRGPNRPLLIVAGLALILLAVVGIQRAVLNENHYRVPVMVLAEGAIIDAFFGLALLYVALRKSQFAGATAVVIATFLMFGVLMDAFASVAFGLAFHISWGKALAFIIAAAILGPSIFPWSPSANKPVFFWISATFGALTLLVGSAAFLARL